MNISPIMANQYNNKGLKRNFNNHPTEQQPISPNFGGVYGNITDGIAKNYYGKAMQSGFVKWLGKKTENMNMINLCSTVNSFIISTMYVIRTLQNKDMNDDRKTTLAINDGLTFCASTALAYGVDNSLAKKWSNVTERYAATRLDMTKEQLAEKIAAANENLLYEGIRTSAIKEANAVLPAEAQIPLKKEIEAIIKAADESLTPEKAKSLLEESNKLCEEINKNRFGDAKLEILLDTQKEKALSKAVEKQKALDIIYSYMTAQEKGSEAYNKFNELLTRANSELPKEKRIPLAQDIEAAIEKANQLLDVNKKIPLIQDIKATIAKANELLPNNLKIKPEQVIKNAEDYTRDVIKAKDLNNKIKGMGIFKSLFIFGMIYRYVVPVLIMKPANKLGAKYNKSHAEKMDAENKRIEMLKDYEAKAEMIKAYESKIKEMETNTVYANAS